MGLYQIGRMGELVRTVDKAIIPSDPRNSDTIEYLKWIAKGNTPDPYIKTAADLQAEQDASDLATARDYPKLKALVKMTPDQLATWCDANLKTDGATAAAIKTEIVAMQDAIKTLVIAVGILARRI